MKAILEFSVSADWMDMQTQWFVYVDDDTYILHGPLLDLLSRYNPRDTHYFGRSLQEEGFPAFVGGGAGIALSRAAALQIVGRINNSSAACDPNNRKWSGRKHQGGDAWLGDCAEEAGVRIDMEYGFYPQPPLASQFRLFTDAVSFHGVANLSSAFRALQPLTAGSKAPRLDPRCVPLFADHRYVCLPHFIIGGVPKAGTTSLYKYLMQHPEVVPAANKELTFWGNFFSPKRRRSRKEVTTKYLPLFPKIEPTDFKVTGEATPGYLYCSTCPKLILKFLPKVKLLFTLRSPLPRAYSEYLNKVADQTVLRYLKKRIDTSVEKELVDQRKQPTFARLVADVARTMQACGSPSRTFSMMDVYSDAQEQDGCYVNPFVGEGIYARYLRTWLGVVPRQQVMLLNFDEWTQDAQPAMQAVAAFLSLAPHTFKLEEAHNTHLARSVHIRKQGASNLSALRNSSVEDQLSLTSYCTLNEFYAPYNAELAGLLADYNFPPMHWPTGTRDSGVACPPHYEYWRTLIGRELEGGV